MKYEVSEDVKKAAQKYAKTRFNPGHLSNVAYNAFIAGASFNQPIEHSQLPEQETKPIEDGK